MHSLDDDARDHGNAEGTSAVLRDLRAARRHQRLASIHWVDAAYQTYLTGLIGIALTLFISSAVGDERLSAADLSSVDRHGGAVIGLLAALAMAVGLRSGSRGGPIAVEAAEVRHVLLAPIDRGPALRGSALRQVRYAAFVGIAGGAIAGELASRRFHTGALAWLGSSALAGMCITVLFVATALVTSGRQVQRGLATVIAAAVLAWSIGDVAWRVWSPFRWFGEIALWPRTFESLGLLAVGFVALLVVLGLLWCGGLMLEAAERRTGLVGQLRFAVTLQDLRTVMVLRRQLAQDQARARPWIKTERSTARFVVARRDLRSLLRFPAPRLIRLVVLTLLASACLRLAWQGTSPLILFAGLALYIVALDVIEPLAQQVDQSDRTDSLPVEIGNLLLRHLAVPTMAMILLGLVGGSFALALDQHQNGLGLIAIFVPAAVLCPLAGAITSVVLGAPEPFKDGQLLPPEVAGLRIGARAAWPVAISVIGGLPVVVAGHALRNGRNVQATAATIGLLVLIPVLGTAMWVGYRVPARVWFRNMLEEGQQAQRERQGLRPT